MKYNCKFPHGIMFHRFKNSKMKYSSPGAVNSRDLKKIIKFIGRKRILNPDEWINKLKKDNLKNKDLCLTFDGGLKSQLNIALPVLNKFNIKAFWFIHSYISPKKFDKTKFILFLLLINLKNMKILPINFLNISTLIKIYSIQESLVIITKQQKIYIVF